jgi:hypothetical protein
MSSSRATSRALRGVFEEAQALEVHLCDEKVVVHVDGRGRRALVREPGLGRGLVEPHVGLGRGDDALHPLDVVSLARGRLGLAVLLERLDVGVDAFARFVGYVEVAQALGQVLLRAGQVFGRPRALLVPGVLEAGVLVRHRRAQPLDLVHEVGGRGRRRVLFTAPGVAARARRGQERGEADHRRHDHPAPAHRQRRYPPWLSGRHRLPRPPGRLA